MCHALRATVFDRLRDALDGCTRLFISPDGGLTRLPFEVLPLPTEGRLMDRYDISYLSTGRDILRFEAQSSGHPTVPVVVADPDFDLTAESPLPDTVTPYPDAEQQRSSAARFVRDLGRERLEFGRLPWAHLEGERIAAQLNGELWCDDTALEARLKACQSPHILHLATHGYFLSDQDYIRDRSNIHQVQQNGIDISELYRFSKPELANPMLRSLLALAGANTWLKDKPLPPEAEDGLLTAADVSGLNLLSTELVVLSACQTALGDVRAGEGVFGLRRAFMLAGAKTLVMSLWDADDLNRATGDWHRDAPADRARVVTLLQPSARSYCAETHDSGDSPCRASPHAGRITPCPVWVLVSPPSAASVRRRADAERSGRRPLLFALQRVSNSSSVPGRHVHLR